MATRLFRAFAVLAVLALLAGLFMYADAWLYLAVRGAALLLLVIGGYLGWRRQHMAARRRRECLNCGYLRRGLPPGSPCPECGGSFD